MKKNKTQHRKIYVRSHTALTAISYEEMGEKIREVEQYMLSNPEKMEEMIEGEEKHVAVGNIMRIFATCLYASVRYGSVEKWIEENTPMTIPMIWLAEKAAEVLAFPDFEFSSEWPWSKQEMLEVCQRVYGERNKDASE
jgi:hypothetical protein